MFAARASLTARASLSACYRGCVPTRPGGVYWQAGQALSLLGAHFPSKGSNTHTSRCLFEIYIPLVHHTSTW
jgi:hypothetical protein